ncbi:hypothetical protein CEXT_541491 [Caerostris extrusa]|uniref:Uncharacterized protein n=1 Tax=Caerostris extrusa TaxID=172846 RepID=A0AAV4UN57_CAEEX|nr:hypothetical protein CEXT_541491 [Caerostris extrusa]
MIERNTPPSNQKCYNWNQVANIQWSGGPWTAVRQHQVESAKEAKNRSLGGHNAGIEIKSATESMLSIKECTDPLQLRFGLIACRPDSCQPYDMRWRMVRFSSFTVDTDHQICNDYIFHLNTKTVGTGKFELMPA